MTPHVFVGYDTREHPAWLVCRDSILNPHIGRNLVEPQVHPLVTRSLRRAGLFTRPWNVAEDGIWTDVRDGRPFSTEFSHSRFLVPQRARELGLRGKVVFVDCDFMFLHAISDMIHSMPIDDDRAVWVVKHEFTLPDGVKMDGALQQRYHRKLWSSLIVFNLDHPKVQGLTAEEVNAQPGSYLHGFAWLDDSEIGSLDPRWNWIPGHSTEDAPYAIHWSFGGPWMPGYADAPYADHWRQSYCSLLAGFATPGTFQATFPLV